MQKLTARKIALSDDLSKKYWAAGLVYPTHFLNAISLSFPVMEKMAVVSIRSAMKKIDDEAVKSELATFCEQENNHSAAHNSFNVMVLEGAAEPAALNRLKEWVKEVSKRSTKERVATVIAFEHFTSSCSRLLMKTLSKAREEGKIDSEAFKLWYWHCAEEIEHHSVCWDLVEPFGITKSELNNAVKEYFTVFYPYLIACTNELVKADSQQWKMNTWLGASVFLSRHFSRMGPYFIHFFSPSFSEHAYDEIDKELLSDFKKSGIEFTV